MKELPNRAFLLGFATLLTACGGQGSGPASAHQSGSFEGFKEGLYQALCNLAERCGAAPPSTSCVETMRRVGPPPGFAQAELSIAAGRARYSATAGAKCLELIDDPDCRASNRDAVERAMAQVVEGTVPEGGVCMAMLECAAGTWCDRPCGLSECCAGQCRARPAEASCAGIDCGPGGSCGESVGRTGSSQDGATSIMPVASCTVLRPLGASCTAETCEGEAVCADDGTRQGSVCILKPLEGESCVGLTCAQLDNYCDPRTLRCTRSRAAGDPCDPSVEHMCLKAAYCAKGVCTAQPSLGESCTDPGQDCWPAQCVNGLCTEPTPLVSSGLCR